MSGTAVRDGKGWMTTPKPGAPRWVHEVFETKFKAYQAAIAYSLSKAKEWRKRARLLEEDMNRRPVDW